MVGGAPPPPPKMGVKMFELAQTNIFTPERKRGGPPTGNSLPAACRGWAWGGVEYAGKAWTWTPTWSALMDFKEFQPRGGEPGGVCRGGARHRLPAQVQAQARRNPRWGPPAATPLRQGPGGHLRRPGPPRHGMLIVF